MDVAEPISGYTLMEGFAAPEVREGWKWMDVRMRVYGDPTRTTMMEIPILQALSAEGIANAIDWFYVRWPAEGEV